MQQPTDARALPLGYLMALAGSSEAMRYYTNLLPQTGQQAGRPYDLLQSRQQMQAYRRMLETGRTENSL